MVSRHLLQGFIGLFDVEIIDAIVTVATVQKFNKNDIIIDIDQDLDSIPLLIDGHVRVLREDKDGNDLLLYILKSGDTCAMSLTCCMAKSKSKIRAIADEDAIVVMIPISKMRTWFNTNESWRNFILQSYQIRFDEMLETIDTLAFLKMDQRLLKYINDQLNFSESNVLEKTHQEIAEDLHTSRVVISRLLKQLENEKRIKLGRNKITLMPTE